MGKELARIFQVVEDKGGLPGRLKLVQAIGITQQQAGELKDKAPLLRKAKKAAAEILAIPPEDLLK
jgi:hypothetical protein